MDDRSTDQTTLDLVRRARVSDNGAWQDLFHRERPRVVAVLAHYLRGRPNLGDLIDDLCQEVYLTAFRRLGSFDGAGPGAFGRWLSGIARNKAREHHAGTEHAPDLDRTSDASPDAVEAMLTTPSSRAARKELNGALLGAIDRLSTDHRRVIVLRYFELLTSQEISEELGRSEGAVRVLLFRAMVALSAELKRSENE